MRNNINLLVEFIKRIKRWTLYFYKRIILLAKYIVVALLPERKHPIMKYPHTIQLPITWKCNFDCVMCGMHHLVQNPDFSAEELGKILRDPLFKRVQAVGLNGGEPFLKTDLVDCVTEIVEILPKLKEINIISNGYLTEKIKTTLPVLKRICANRGVKLSISFSVDGVKETQNFMRGHKNAWESVNKTIHMIQDNPSNFCDDLGIICTITKWNIYNIPELENWAKETKVKVSYNIATVNARIDNYEKLENFSVLWDEEARYLTQEFFYKKFLEEKVQKYFGLFLYLQKSKRYSPCVCSYNGWVTLTPDSQISYCATHSKVLGNAQEKSAHDIFNGNIEYLKELTSKYCEGCSHYMYTLNKEGKILMYKELLRIQKCMF